MQKNFLAVLLFSLKKADKNLRKKNESDIVKEERQPPTRWVARLVRRKAAP